MRKPRQTAAQMKQLLAQYEAEIRRHRGDRLRVAKALQGIAKKGLYRVQPHKLRPDECYATIRDYALNEWQMTEREFHRDVEWMKVIDAIRDHCPVGQSRASIQTLAKLLPERASRELTPLLGMPTRVYQAFREAAKQPRHPSGHIKSASVLAAAAPHRDEMAATKMAAALVKPSDPQFVDHFVTADMLNGLPMLANDFDHVVTSPPYGVGNIDYGETFKDDRPHADYLKLLAAWLKVCCRKLKKGGRLAINIPNTYSRDRDRELIHPLPTRVVNIVEKISGMKLMAWITWDRGRITEALSSKNGSFNSCRQPGIRRRSEALLVFAKGTFQKQNYDESKRLVTDEDYPKWTEDVWQISPDTTTRRNYPHPCVFPKKLVEQYLRVYGQRGDKVLDPFGGSGTTAIVAHSLECDFRSVDINSDFTKLAHNRFTEESQRDERRKKRLAKTAKRK